MSSRRSPTRTRTYSRSPDKFLPLLERLAGVRATVAALKSDLANLSAPAAKPADTHAFGTFDAGKARDQFAAQASKDAIDEGRKTTPGASDRRPPSC